jgi:hypothetical protein
MSTATLVGMTTVPIGGMLGRVAWDVANAVEEGTVEVLDRVCVALFESWPASFESQAINIKQATARKRIAGEDHDTPLLLMLKLRLVITKCSLVRRSRALDHWLLLSGYLA